LKPDSPQYGDRNKELLQAAVDLKVWGELMQQDLQRSQKQQMKSLFEKIEEAITEVAQQKGVDLVIAEQRPELPESIDQISVDQLRMLINQRNVLYATPKADISNEVIALLDSKYKAGRK
ncbi:MAG: OmpH family outer membrane protein, partial [Tepidisphaeraceae bacterium]